MEQQDERNSLQDGSQRDEKGDYAGEQTAGGQYGDAGQEQGKSGQASYGNSGEPDELAGGDRGPGYQGYGESLGAGGPPGGAQSSDGDLQGLGQSSAAARGMSSDETMTQAPREAGASTSAQQSGGQSFQSSSFAGQFGTRGNEGGVGGEFIAGRQDDTSSSYVSQEESGGQDFDRDGQGAGASDDGGQRERGRNDDIAIEGK